MLVAIDKAKKAYDNGEVPVGAVIVNSEGKIIETAGNSVISMNDPTAHAEILAIRNASKKLKTDRLELCDLYVTLEPCPMCSHAISLARIRRLYFGAFDTKYNHLQNSKCTNLYRGKKYAPEVISGLNELKCSELIKSFFNELR